ncbi:SPK domain-containing protein [Caenorhabditis elegans]|uniref:SPK domain-containing protein n=1 Tax=Caenorhabditis elegans TaxID=6239 RepID=Q9U3Q7_CAEEL|nr:SPK domain-containing protein [Caenorhabditis elegans]CAB62782.1 SPK domain-containing protein [Caenorhabditis elegans]|eukprot:NP_502632.1 Uncharacterized protein CELE_C08F11.7 [Caenorhabditis elegans]
MLLHIRKDVDHSRDRSDESETIGDVSHASSAVAYLPAVLPTSQKAIPSNFLFFLKQQTKDIQKPLELRSLFRGYIAYAKSRKQMETMMRLIIPQLSKTVEETTDFSDQEKVQMIFGARIRMNQSFWERFKPSAHLTLDKFSRLAFFKSDTLLLIADRWELPDGTMNKRWWGKGEQPVIIEGLTIRAHSTSSSEGPTDKKNQEADFIPTKRRKRTDGENNNS